MLTTYEKEERKEGKQLYHYQKGAIQKIFQCFESAVDKADNEHIVLCRV